MSKAPKHRALANALRDAREQSGLKLRTLAEHLDCNWATLSRYETGAQVPRLEEVGRILGTLGVNRTRYKEIVQLAYDAASSASWVGTLFEEQRQQLRVLADVEGQAKRITEAHLALIPGLLQISDYVQAIHSRLPNDEAQARNALRLDRQRVLTQPFPPHYTALICEQALYQPLGGREVMIEQLRTLVKMAERPNIDLRVIRFGTEYHPVLRGAFHIVEGYETSAVFVESSKSLLVLHKPDELEVYRQTAKEALQAAMNRKDSQAFVANFVRRMESAK